MNSQSGQSSRLYVGGLDLSIQEKDLEELFSKYGKILEIRWRKNFAFVQFSDDSEAQDAIKDLNGSQHFGRMLDVQVARHPRGGGGGSGGSGGGPPKGNDDMPSRDRSPIGRSGGGGGRGGMGGRGGGFGGRGDRGMYNSGGGGGGRNSFNDDMPPSFGGRGGGGGGGAGSGGDFRSDYRGGGGDFPSRQDPSPFGGRSSDNSLFGGGSGGSGRDFSLAPPTGFRDAPGGGSKFWGGGSGGGLNEKAFDSRNRGNEISPGMQYQERPPTHPIESTSVPNNERTNDIEIIVVEKSLTDYGEMIERRMSCLGFSVDVLFPHEAVPLPRVLANIASRGTLYAVVITHVHKINRSLTLHVLHSRPQEHRNIAIDDAVTLLLRNYESYTRNCRDKGAPNSPPEQIRHLLTQVLNGRQLTITQYDILVQHLIQEKLKLEPQANQVSEGQNSTAQQAELQTRILSILNKTPVTNDPPQQVPPPSALQTTGPLLQDPSIQKALDSLIQGGLMATQQQTPFGRF